MAGRRGGAGGQPPPPVLHHRSVPTARPEPPVPTAGGGKDGRALAPLRAGGQRVGGHARSRQWGHPQHMSRQGDAPPVAAHPVPGQRRRRTQLSPEQTVALPPAGLRGSDAASTGMTTGAAGSEPTAGDGGVTGGRRPWPERALSGCGVGTGDAAPCLAHGFAVPCRWISRLAAAGRHPPFRGPRPHQPRWSHGPGPARLCAVLPAAARRGRARYLQGRAGLRQHGQPLLHGIQPVPQRLQLLLHLRQPRRPLTPLPRAAERAGRHGAVGRHGHRRPARTPARHPRGGSGAGEG